LAAGEDAIAAPQPQPVHLHQHPQRKGTMSFIEVESWLIREGKEEDHHDMIRRWFQYVQKNHADMFAEWKSARYYRQTDRDGNLTGRYIMVFEFYTVEGFHAYKERRKDFNGPYAEYQKFDPYQYFIHESVEIEYWEPQETQLWFEFESPY
jgi:hypothetical protein